MLAFAGWLRLRFWCSFGGLGSGFGAAAGGKARGSSALMFSVARQGILTGKQNQDRRVLVINGKEIGELRELAEGQRSRKVESESCERTSFDCFE